MKSRPSGLKMIESVNEDEIDRRDEMVKEVFAYFGATYYHAEVLHRGLCNLFVWSQVSTAGPMNRYRVEEHYAKAFGATLGQLVKTLEPYFAVDQFIVLEAASERRNFIAHHFWFERIHLMGTPKGCAAMISELNSAEELFRKADAFVDVVTAPYLSKMGIAQEMLSKMFDEAMQGQPIEPLRAQRKVKKQEVVLRAYEVPGEGQGINVLFETDDGAIWQLCDVGLGWSSWDAANPIWPLSPRLNEFLPATIDPRPKHQKAWHYEIDLNGATLVVRPSKVPGVFSFSIRTKK